MIYTSNWETAQATRKARTISGGGGVVFTDYIRPEQPQKGKEVFPLPSAHSAEQAPGSVSLAKA
jgi:hypothetical protein